MKVINVLSSLSHRAGGIFYAVSGLTKAQREGGLDVAAWGLLDKEAKEDARQWGEVSLRFFEAVGPKNFGYTPTLDSALEKYNPDLLHIHGIWAYPSIAMARWHKKTGRPVIISPHGMLDPWALAHKAWKKRLAWFFFQKEVLRQCGCLHALCQAEADAIRELKLGIPIAIIANGVEIPRLKIRHLEKNPKVKTMIYIGRLHEKKNLLALVKAWRALPKKLASDWELRIVGWGQEAYRQELMLKAGGNIHLEGALHGGEKAEAFREADAFILPSFSEGLPLAVLEAWSYGLPVLMSDQCNLPEGFAKGAAIETGTSSEGIESALGNFLKMDKIKRQTMGRNGRKLVERKFSLETMALKMEEVYHWLLQQGPRPECVQK